MKHMTEPNKTEKITSYLLLVAVVAVDGGGCRRRGGATCHPDRYRYCHCHRSGY